MVMLWPRWTLSKLEALELPLLMLPREPDRLAMEPLRLVTDPARCPDTDPDKPPTGRACSEAGVAA